MRTLLCCSVVVSGLLGGVPRAAADEPREVLAQAIQALGGKEKVVKLRSVQRKTKGHMEIAGARIAFTAEESVQLPDHFKLAMDLQAADDKATIIDVLTAGNAWRCVNGRTEELKDPLRSSLREMLTHLSVAALLPRYLEDQSVTLSSLGEVAVNGQPVVGVKISAKGKKDIDLYFDKMSHLLVKTVYQNLDNQLTKEVAWDVIYSDFKEEDGLKRPTKIVLYEDGKKYLEAEVTDQRLVEQFDGSEFAKP